MSSNCFTGNQINKISWSQIEIVRQEFRKGTAPDETYAHALTLFHYIKCSKISPTDFPNLKINNICNF